VKDPKIVYEISKNGLEIIRASICESNSHEVVDIRAHFRGEDGEWQPSRKGLAVPIDKIDEMAKSVGTLQEALEPI